MKVVELYVARLLLRTGNRSFWYTILSLFSLFELHHSEIAHRRYREKTLWCFKVGKRHRIGYRVVLLEEVWEQTGFAGNLRVFFNTNKSEY